MVTCPAYREKFTWDSVIAPFSLLSVVIVTLPCNNNVVLVVCTLWNCSSVALSLFAKIWIIQWIKMQSEECWERELRGEVDRNSSFPVAAALPSLRSFPSCLERTTTPRHVCTVPATFLQSSEDSPFQPFLSRLSILHIEQLVSLSDTCSRFYYLTCLPHV